MGSLSEIETQYQLLAIRLEFIKETPDINALLKSVAKLLMGTRNYLLKK